MARTHPPRPLRSAHPFASLTIQGVRASLPLDLDGRIEELEAAAANAFEARGVADEAWSRLIALAHPCVRDAHLPAPLAKTPLDSKGPRAETHFVLWLAAEKWQVQVDALDHYEQAFEADPFACRALFHTARISLQFGSAADALDSFKTVAVQAAGRSAASLIPY